MKTEEIILLNGLRRCVAKENYDPVRGIDCCGRRVHVTRPSDVFIPEIMTCDPNYEKALFDLALWRRLRCRYDFEYWCATCAFIKPKNGHRPAYCRPNRGQRNVIEVLESQRAAGYPMRIIVLKARQWGCSTILQLYIAWLQTCVSTGLNALVCAHTLDISKNIRGMYSRVLKLYPEELWCGTEKPRMTPYESADAIRSIAGRDCTLVTVSANNADAVRGIDISLAHMSEVAYWRSTPTFSPSAVAQSVYGTVPLCANSLIALESTANGVGNFFHREWLRCRGSRGDKVPVFVPWHEIESYRTDAATADELLALASSLDEEESELWHYGLCLEQIYWHRKRRLEFDDVRRFHAEFPANDTEAFECTTTKVFDPRHINALRASCLPCAKVGAISESTGKFVFDAAGHLNLWLHPQKRHSYVVSVDVGGRSPSADWSVIAVMTRPDDKEEKPELVAQWRGHVDHDILADTAARIAAYYNDALLVIESNTFETETYGGTADNPNGFILARLAMRYPNLYTRRYFDRSSGETSRRYGFHTNASTKPMLIGNLIATVREGAYIEHDSMACDEMATYEQRPNGSYGAEAPNHDDILMTRAIALYVIATEYTPAAPGKEGYGQTESW